MSATPGRWWPYFGDWLRRAHQVVSASADVLNRLNVFPVSDSDTGTNVELTLAGILEALPASGRVAADDLVRAAVLSAHGNSGAIVAEMLISVAREASQPGTGSTGERAHCWRTSFGSRPRRPPGRWRDRWPARS